MNSYKRIFLALLIGATSGIILSIISNYLYNRDKAAYELGKTLNIVAHYPSSADAALSAQLIVAELKLYNPKDFQAAKSLLEELISQNVKEDIKIRAQEILARHLRNI